MPRTRAPETPRDASRLALLIAAALLVTPGPAPVAADVIFDGTIGPLGEGTSARTESGLYIIPEDDGERQGSNLFHSFSVFDVARDETARLDVARDETARLTGSDPDLERVILRVTAGKFTLDGTLESVIPDVDVIVLSPAGIDVGGEATFDLQGSLSMSTAQTLAFSDGSFRSSAEGDPWSSSDPAVPCCGQAPTGFGFDVNTDPDVGNFDLHLPIDQVLRVPRGEVLRVVARKFTGNGGQITSDGGTIYIAAVGAGAVEVPVDVDADLDTDASWLSGVGSDASVELHNVSVHAESELPNNPIGGRVLLRGGRLVVGNGSVVRAYGEPTKPAIDLVASQSIVIDGTLQRYQGSLEALIDVPGVRLMAPEVTLGNDGLGEINVESAGIEIRAGSLRLARNSTIRVLTESVNNTRPIVLDVGTLSMEGENTSLEAYDRAPDAPNSILIGASGVVELRDGASISTHTRVSSDAGGIAINAAALYMEGDGTAIQTQGRDPDTPESLLVVATGEVSLRDGAVITSLPSGSQDAGDIRVEAGALSLEDGGQIQSPTESARATGNIDVVVDGPIRISGVKVLGNDKAHAGLRTQAGPSAGDVTIEADSLEITDGGLITSSSMESGSAGEIRIRVRGHMLIGGSDEGKPVEIASRGFGTADAGSVDLQVGSLEIRDDGGIFVGSFGTQPGGGISIDAADQVTIVDGNVNAQSYFSEAGGDISITAGNLIQLVRSKIETRVRNEEGRGGNIFIGGDVGPRLAVINNSRIKADANQGPGGNITIRAGNLLMSAEPGQIDASSDAGLDGSVEIAAPEVQAEGQLAPLPVAYLDVTAILREHCASQRGAGASSFVIEGRPGIAPEPGGYLPSFPSAPAGEDTAPPGTSQAPNLRAASVVTQLTRFDCGRDWPLSAAR